MIILISSVHPQTRLYFWRWSMVTCEPKYVFEMTSHGVKEWMVLALGSICATPRPWWLRCCCQDIPLGLWWHETDGGSSETRAVTGSKKGGGSWVPDLEIPAESLIYCLSPEKSDGQLQLCLKITLNDVFYVGLPKCGASLWLLTLVRFGAWLRK